MILDLLSAGLNGVKEYVVLHALTSLLPAFFLAGAIVTFVSRDGIVTYLGIKAKKLTSFGISAAAGFLLATDSMTVIPVAKSVYSTGAGIGATFVLLWVAPAANILALVYTGVVIGLDMVVARIIAALVTAGIIGTVMAFTFHKQDKNRILSAQASGGHIVTRNGAILLILLVVWLIAPNNVLFDGSYLFKILVWAIGLVVISIFAIKAIPVVQLKAWLNQTWGFVKSIVPLLLAGVFVVGIVGVILPQDVAMRYVGGIGLRPSFFASLIGAAMYFPNLTETAFSDTLMGLGMGKGPTLALLLNATGTSLLSWLVIGKIFGVKKSLIYAFLIILLGTLVGLIGEAYLR